MASKKVGDLHTVWLGVGLERPRIHCHQMRGGRSSPSIAVCAMTPCRVSKRIRRTKQCFRQWQSVTNVILTLCTSFFSDFCTLHAIHVIFWEVVRSRVSGESNKVRTTKTGGSDPENFGLSRPKFGSGSLPPYCSQFAESERGQRQIQLSSHAHFDNPRMQEGEA